MLSFFRKPAHIGLDLGTKSIKLVAVKQVDSAIQVTHMAAGPTPVGALEGGMVKDPQRLGLAIKQAFTVAGLKDRRVHTTISGQHLFVRHLVLPEMPKKELEQVIRFQAETNLPIPINEAVLDYAICGTTEQDNVQHNKVLLVATRRAVVAGLVDAFQAAGVHAQSVDICPLAMYRALQGQIKKELKPLEQVVLINVGTGSLVLSIFQKDILQRVRVLPLLQSTPEDLAMEIRRSVEYYQFDNREAKMGRVLISGMGNLVEKVMASLKQKLDIPVEWGDPLIGLQLPSKINQEERRMLQVAFPTALGLAVKGLIK